MKKRIISAGLAALMTVSLLPATALAASGTDNFKKTQTYSAGIFTDVVSGSWYDASVQNAYEYALMKGTSDTKFSPNGNITIGSSIALACRIHSIYHTGTADFVQGSP